MILVCAWCSRFLGLKEPLAGVELSHGICHICSVRLNWFDGGGSTRERPPTLVIGRSRKDLLPIIEDLFRAVPEIEVRVDRRVGERRRASTAAKFPSNRRGDRREGIHFVLV